MPDSKGFPPVLPALVAELDRLYPEACPDPTHTEREIWMRAGARRVVRFLRAKEAEQQQAIITHS